MVISNPTNCLCSIEYSGDYNESIYLRSRFYTPAIGRFLTRDTWNGSINRPLSLNRWVYGLDNPSRYTDPSGFCPSCYIFLFPGAGNQGDVSIDGGNKNENLEDNLGREIYLVRELRARLPDTMVQTVYPYGTGIRTNWDPIKGKPSLQQDSNGNIRFAILPAAYELSNIPTTKAKELQDYYGKCIDDNKYNITFIGYSGGGQMAYSTAQSLIGRIQIDNLVLLGAPIRAHSGKGNIGHIWDLAWQDDPFKGLDTVLGWDRYNSGYRLEPSSNGGPWGFDMEYLQEDSLDIYQNGATRCMPYGPKHQHYGNGDYFDIDKSKYPVYGMTCTEGGSGYYLPNTEDRSRVEFLVNFLINIVGAGREK